MVVNFNDFEKLDVFECCVFCGYNVDRASHMDSDKHPDRNKPCNKTLQKLNVNLVEFGALPIDDREVSLEDNLPKRICDSCFGNLESYYQFRNKAAETEKQLLNCLSQVEQSVTDSSFTTEQSQTNIIIVKNEETDISETGSKTQGSSIDQLGNNCKEEKSNKRVEDGKLNDVDEPLSKRRKKSDTLQIKTHKSLSANTFNLPFTSKLDITSDIKIEEDCGVQDTMDQSQSPYLESTNNEEELESTNNEEELESTNNEEELESTNNEEELESGTSNELQSGTSDVALSVNDALSTFTEQEDGGNKCNQIDSQEVPSNMKLKDCVVVLGDLENVNVKEYQFVKQPIIDLKPVSTCILICYHCGANFGSIVSPYINHLITEHSGNEGDNVTDEEAAPTEKNIISCKYCNDTFEAEELHQKHLTTVHPYSCGRCNRVFMNVHQSLLHTKMHFIMDKRKPEEKQKKSKAKNVSTDKEAKSEQKMKKEVKQTKEMATQITEEVKQTREETKQIEEVKQTKEEVKQTKEGAKEMKEEVKLSKEGENQTKEGAKQTEMNKLPQEPMKKINELQKNYNCTECDSKFEDCYQLQRHRVWKHRKKPEKRYEYIKLYKCVLCAKHYPSQQMLDDHKTTHLIDVRTAVEEIEPKTKEAHLPKPGETHLPKPGETHLPKPGETHLSKPGETHLSKPKGTTLLKPKGANFLKPKGISLLKPNETNLPKPKETSQSAASAIKTTESALLLNNDDIIEISSDENKRPNLDETNDILDNVEIICNDIEFDNEDTTNISNETEQSQNQNLPSETLSSMTIESHQTQLLTGTTETPFQTKNAFPQINFIHPPPLVIPNLNQAVTKFVQMLPGNCSILTVPCASSSTQNLGTTATPNFTNNQNLLSNTNNAKQIKLIQVDNSQACVGFPSNIVNNTPIVLNNYLKQNVDPVFNLKTNVNSTIKFRQIKPKLQISNKKTTIPDSANKKGVEEVITLIIEKELSETKIDTSQKKEQEMNIAAHNVEKPVETTNREESNSKLLESANSEESKLREILNWQEPNSKLMEMTNLEPSSCIKIDSSDSGESDNNKEQSGNNISLASQTKDIIEIDSSSDESKSEENSQQNSGFRLLCAICNRRHSARHITMKYQIYICIWCNYTVSVITKKIELFDKFKSPLATGILTTLGRIEFLKSHIQCNICKLIQAETEYKYKTASSLVVCNLCKLKTASMTAILLGIREKARYNNSKRTEQNKFCKVTCETCGIAVRIQTITYFNNKIVVCDSCRPKLFEIAAVSSSIHCKTENNSEEENVLLQTQCYICKDMKHVNNISLLNDKSMCGDCKFNVSNFAIFLNILQKPKRCLNCKRLKKGLQLEELSTYCSKCLQHRPNACLKCDKSGTLGQCSCEKFSEEKVKNTETEISEDEDKLIIDIESENKTEGQKQKGKRSARRQSNGSSSSSIEILEAAEESSVSQESTEDTPCTSSTNIVPKIFLKPMHSLLEPTSKTLMQTEMNDQKSDTFTCFYCSLVCNSKAALAIHKDNVHLCRICKKYRENVPQHLKNIVKCQICQTIFCKKFSLGDHYRQKHDSRWCAICDTVLRDDYEVLLHRKIVHNQS